MRAQRPRIILPAGELRHLGGLHLGEGSADPGVAQQDDARRLWRGLSGVTMWLGFTAFCAVLSAKPVGWVPALATDWNEPLAALRDAALTDRAGLRAASMSGVPDGLRRAAQPRTPAPAPVAAVPRAVVASAAATAEPGLVATRELNLPPVPRQATDFGRWLPGVVPKSSTEPARSTADAARTDHAHVASQRAPGCWPDADGNCGDGSWGESDDANLGSAPAIAVARSAPGAATPGAASLGAAAAAVSDRREVRAPAVEAPFDTRPAPLAPRREASPVTAVAGMSCEAAFASATQNVDLTRRAQSTGPDVTRSAYAGVLETEPFAQCPMDFAVELQICVAVKHGRALGVTVTSRPGNAALSSCVAARVRKLTFPESGNLDLVRTELTIR